MKRWIPVLAVAALAAACLGGWAGYRYILFRVDEAALELGREALREKRYDEAREHLAPVLERRPDWSESAYMLSLCALATGDADSAVPLLERIPPGMPWSDNAALRLAQLRYERQGRLADAERGLESLLDRHKADAIGTSARSTLEQIYLDEGRVAEALGLLESRFPLDPTPVPLLRRHWDLDRNGPPLEPWEKSLAEHQKRAPDDDRVALGLASLDLKRGRVDRAVERIDGCLKQRPDDPAVWHARLAWARLAGRPDEALRAAKKVRGDRSSPAERCHFRRGWPEAGDAAAERAALEKLAEQQPLQALVRLIELAPANESAALRDRKSKLDKAADRYRMLVEGDPGPSSFVELATLAESLGRRFEAWAWASLALRGNPNDTLMAEAVERLDPVKAPRPASESTLADLLSSAPVNP
ncbi:MAG: tetratricopeptide repeat protein [Isosphaeraceae bacterium]